ncbi:hypothetical protein [Actinomadura darangshiensis]|uniref:hypothetical protein n=1 Tax=Actinomadura darangshiensis TaxID=705336 RepID=UPI00140C6569|nr:hypothetical protein [Actinomadura darangshiensis]
MAGSAARTETQFEPSRPWVVGAVLLCAVGTLGTVAVAASPGSETRDGTRRGPGFADVFRIAPDPATVGASAVVAVVTAAGLAALWWSMRRSWPWLLTAGVVLTIPGEFVQLMSPRGTTGDAAWLARGPVTAGAQLVLLGTLAAGARLVHIGAPGAGAVLIGAGAGAQVFGASTDVWIVEPMLLRPGASTSAVQSLLHDGMLLAAVGGALLVMMLHRRYDGRPELAAPSGAEPAMGVRTVIAGAAAALSFVPAAGMGTSTGGFGVAACCLLLTAGLAAALPGLHATAGTIVASATVVGISGPAAALIRSEHTSFVRMWFLLALGVVAGAAAAFPSWRRWSAPAGCAACALALAVTMLIRPDGVTTLLLALQAATATATIGSLGVWLAKDGLPPVVLGPLLFATVTGACGLFAHWQGADGRGPTQDLFKNPGHLWPYPALLLLAALAIAALHHQKARPATK